MTPGDTVKVTFTLANTGAREGAEIAEVYAALPASAEEPPKRLVGFTKVKLDAGEKQTVTVEIDPKYLSIFDEAKDGWTLVPGDYTIHGRRFVGGFAVEGCGEPQVGVCCSRRALIPHGLAARLGARDASALACLRLQLLLQIDEIQIVAERLAEPLVAIRDMASVLPVQRDNRAARTMRSARRVRSRTLMRMRFGLHAALQNLRRHSGVARPSCCFCRGGSDGEQAQDTRHPSFTGIEPHGVR